MLAPATKTRSETLKRLLRSPTFDIAVGIILFWTFCAIFGYRIAPHDPTFQTIDILQSPSGKYPFGTDQIGRDVLSRTLAGARATMIIASCATVIFITLGTALGLALGYFRGWFDETTGRLIDAFLAIPGIIFLIAVIASLGTSIPTLIITIGLAFTPIVARTVRAAVLAEAGQDYVQAAKLRGERAPYILFVEILPNILPPIIVEGTVRLGYAIFIDRGDHVPRARPAAAQSRLVGRHHRRLPEPQRHGARRLLLDRPLPGSRHHLALRCGRDARR